MRQTTSLERAARVLCVSIAVLGTAAAAAPWTQLLTASATAAQAKDQRTQRRPALIPPKRVVAVQSIDIKLTKASGTGGASLGIGVGNASAGGSQSEGEITISNTQDFSEGVGAAMITSLTESKGFQVVDLPQSLQPSGMNGTAQPTSSEQATAPGDAEVQPDLVMRAVITNMSCRRRSGGLSIGDLSGGQGQFENKVTMDVRLVDPLTNLVVDSVRATGRKTSKNSIFGATKFSTYNPAEKLLDLSFADFQESPLAEATRLATEDAVKKLIAKAQQRPWEAKVIQFVEEENGLEIYLNATAETGLREGDELVLIQRGEPITDKASGKVIGRKRDVTLGTVVVILADAERVICRSKGVLHPGLQLEQSLAVRQK